MYYIIVHNDIHMDVDMKTVDVDIRITLISIMM